MLRRRTRFPAGQNLFEKYVYLDPEHLRKIHTRRNAYNLRVFYIYCCKSAMELGANPFLFRRKKAAEKLHASPSLISNYRSQLIDMDILRPAQVDFGFHNGSQLLKITGKLGEWLTSLEPEIKQYKNARKRQQAKQQMRLSGNATYSVFYIYNTKALYIKNPFIKILFTKVNKDFHSLQNNSSQQNFFLERWNFHKHVPRHKDPKTSVYKKAAKYFRQLQTGTFFNSTRPFDPDWLKKNNLENGFRSKKWTQAEILLGIDNLAKVYDPDYWPMDKKRIPRQLPALLYNPRTHISWWLLFAKEGPARLPSTQSCVNPEVLEYVVERTGLSPTWKLIDCINRIIDFHESGLYRRPHMGYADSVNQLLPKGKPEVMIDRFLRFLENDEPWVFDHLDDWVFDPQGKIFKRYIADEGDYAGVDIVTGACLME